MSDKPNVFDEKYLQGTVETTNTEIIVVRIDPDQSKEDYITGSQTSTSLKQDSSSDNSEDINLQKDLYGTGKPRREIIRGIVKKK